MSFEVDYFTLSPADATNEYVVLNGIPVDSSNVAMDIIGGTAQALIGDFGVTDSTVHWDNTSYGLNGMLDSSDNIRIIYDKS